MVKQICFPFGTLIETELNTKEIKLESAFSVYLCQHLESHSKVLVNTVFWRVRVVLDNTRRRCNSLVLGTVEFFSILIDQPFIATCLHDYESCSGMMLKFNVVYVQVIC